MSTRENNAMKDDATYYLQQYWTYSKKPVWGIIGKDGTLLLWLCSRDHALRALRVRCNNPEFEQATIKKITKS